MSKVFVLTGMPGAGKEEFVKVAQSYGYSVIRMGDVVRMEAEKRKVVMDDRGVGGFATSERQAHGPGIWAERCLPYVSDGNFIIDGSRSLNEIEVFRTKLGKGVKIVAIHTSPERRFARLQARGRYDAPKSWKEFKERDDRELGWGLGSLIALADVMVVNESSLEDFHEKVEEELERPW
jgi:dephospho-CoA kinase